MAPTSEKTVPTKKSLRIWVRNNGHVMRKKTRETFVYPRTVEAAKDPFECTSGKNKMFYLIAINLFPESKIVRPDDSDSEMDVENTTANQNDMECGVEEANFKLEPAKLNKKRNRTRKSPTDDKVLPTDSESSTNCSSTETSPSKAIQYQPEPITLNQLTGSAASPKKSGQKSTTKRRLIAVKKARTMIKMEKATNNVNFKEECSTVSDCENCLSNTNSSETSRNVKTKGHDLGAKGGMAVLATRKLPAIPTIMNNLHKIIETCSASGVVSFSLPKNKPRQSRA